MDCEVSDMSECVENRVTQSEAFGISPETKKRRMQLKELFLDNLEELKELFSTFQNEKKVIRFTKLSDNATQPSYSSESAAGADLYSAEDCVIPAKGKYLVATDIQVEIPQGYYGRIAPRSGLASKHFIDVGAGVVDSDYRGHLKILLFNFGDKDFEVKKSDRIAQMICERIAHCQFEEVKSLDVTIRGSNGFGSTGV
ncbi:hypothetical protein AB6A40_008690 [Gnathostoma spinigerum]|uniref:Deoxyuridine 5'-triphosphate nucleotidohydrolase n=1 Tax=Gnathostoma spinigerum TaxID=75299 RepID=A0ABD6EQ64_9BILA